MHATTLDECRQHAMIVAAVGPGRTIEGSGAEIFDALFAKAASGPDLPSCGAHLDHLLREMSARRVAADRIEIIQPRRGVWRLRSLAPAAPTPSAIPLTVRA